MSSCYVKPFASGYRPYVDADNVRVENYQVDLASGRSSGVLERKLTDHVNKQLMAAHLRLDLKQVEKPEVGRLYQEVSPAILD